MSVGKHSYACVRVGTVTEHTFFFYAQNFKQTVPRQPFGLGIHLLKRLFTALAGQGNLMATVKSKVCTPF